MNPFIMHINFAEAGWMSFGKRTVDDICKMAAAFGYNGVEFRGQLPVEYEKNGFKEYAKAIGEAKKKYGLTDILFGIGVSDSGNSDKAARDASIADAIEKAKIASEYCGTTLCNTFGQSIKSPVPTVTYAQYELNGSAAMTDEQYKLTVEAFQKIGEEIAKLGMKFAFETHMNYIHDLPEPSKKLVDDINMASIGINMDYGNTVYFPTRPELEEAIDIYGDKIFYTHFKNSAPVGNSRMATSLSQGDINHRAYIEKLQSIGFTGPMGIEAPRGGDRIHYAKEDLDYIKSIFASEFR